jgi:hypothetical protein
MRRLRSHPTVVPPDPWSLAPSGLWLPTQVPKDRLFLQIAGEGDRAAVAVIDRLPSFIDYTYSYVDEVAVDAPVSELDHVVDWLSRVPFDVSVNAVSWLAGLVHDRPMNREAQLALADAIYTDQGFLLEPVRSAIRRGRSVAAVAPQIVSSLARLVLLHSPADRAPRSVDQLYFERALLGVTALGRGAREEQPPERDVLASLTQLGAINARIPVLEALARCACLYAELATSDEARARPDFCDVEAWSRAHLGVSPVEQVELAFVAMATAHALDAPGIKVPYGRLAADWADVQAPHFEATADQITELISAPRQWFIERFQSWEARQNLSPADAAGAFYTVPFESRPFLRLRDGTLLLWSPRALLNWATEGLFHRLHDIAKAEKRDVVFRGFHARLTEKYCVDLLREALPSLRRVGNGVVHGEIPYRTKFGETRSPDIAVDFGPDLIFMEVTSGRLTAATYALGDATSVESDLGRLVVEKASQLSRRIDDFREGKFILEGVDRSNVRRIWPVVITAPGLFMTEPLWRELNRRLADALTQPNVQPLVVLDVYDLEVLAGLLEAGKHLPDLLAAKTGSPYVALDWSRMVADDPHLDPVRPASVVRRSSEQFRRLAERFGFDPDGLDLAAAA